MTAFSGFKCSDFSDSPKTLFGMTPHPHVTLQKIFRNIFVYTRAHTLTQSHMMRFETSLTLECDRRGFRGKSRLTNCSHCRMMWHLSRQTFRARRKWGTWELRLIENFLVFSAVRSNFIQIMINLFAQFSSSLLFSLSFRVSLIFCKFSQISVETFLRTFVALEQALCGFYLLRDVYRWDLNFRLYGSDKYFHGTESFSTRKLNFKNIKLFECFDFLIHLASHTPDNVYGLLSSSTRFSVAQNNFFYIWKQFVNITGKRTLHEQAFQTQEWRQEKLFSLRQVQPTNVIASVHFMNNFLLWIIGSSSRQTPSV